MSNLETITCIYCGTSVSIDNASVAACNSPKCQELETLDMEALSADQDDGDV